MLNTIFLLAVNNKSEAMDPVTSQRYPKAKEVIDILNTELTVDGVSISIAEDLNEVFFCEGTELVS